MDKSFDNRNRGDKKILLNSKNINKEPFKSLPGSSKNSDLNKRGSVLIASGMGLPFSGGLGTAKDSFANNRTNSQLHEPLSAYHQKEDGDMIREDGAALSMSDLDSEVLLGGADPLVKFGVDMTELSEYLDNIITVVNQHAKLLDKVSEELEVRPK